MNHLNEWRIKSRNELSENHLVFPSYIPFVAMLLLKVIYPGTLFSSTSILFILKSTQAE